MSGSRTALAYLDEMAENSPLGTSVAVPRGSASVPVRERQMSITQPAVDVFPPPPRGISGTIRTGRGGGCDI